MISRSCLAIVATSLITLAGCNREVGNPAPVRVEGPATFPVQTSTIVVPVNASLDELAAGLNRNTPRVLWTIDEHRDKCVPAQRVNIGIAKIKVLPTLGCRIVGQVARGAITLGGSGERLIIRMPVSATIHVRDVGGLIKQETATGAAIVRADGRLSITGNWVPTAKVSIAYDWTDPPGIDLFGQRIRFADKADQKLQGVIAKLQRTLPQELAKIRLRERLAGVWRQAFTSIQLNRDKPPAWMRVTPRRLGFGGYRIAGRTLELTLAAEATTETFVGARPPDPVPTPLPPPSPTIGPRGLRFFIPVLADYGQLEPVVERALRKLAAKGITISGVGPVDAEFGKVTVYATTGGRLAVGIRAKVKPTTGTLRATTKGEVWLSAIPYNDPGSQVVRVRDLQLAGQTDSNVVNLLFTLFADTAVQDNIRGALTHDFAPDYQKVLLAARKAIGNRQEGDFLLSADVTEVRNGAIAVTGAGLFLPVEAGGTATIVYRPR